MFNLLICDVGIHLKKYLKTIKGAQQIDLKVLNKQSM